VTAAPSFAVRDVHQLEITSRCNLRCVYCVHPKMARAKEDMTEDTFRAALGWVRRFVDAGTQTEVNLAGIGESTMHPDFVRFVHLARELAGDRCELVLATNGLLMTDDVAQAIASARPRVFVSLHRPEKAGPAIEALRRAGLLAGVSADPSVAATDWAGQVKWHRSAAPRECMWVRGGKVMVLSDGRITTCSFDGTGKDILGRITDDLTAMRTQPYFLCPTCDQSLGIAGWSQERAEPW
jgi:MoaA/NifB/PqqE/SkfB family radical SAM enzyme